MCTVVLSGFGDEIFHSERTCFMSGTAGEVDVHLTVIIMNELSIEFTMSLR